MKWLREHAEYSSDEPASTEPDETVVRFRRDMPNSAADDGSTALELVHQAVELIRGAENRATDLEARAQVIVQQAIERLELAERRVHSAEAQREAALAGIEETNVRAREIEKALKRAKSGLAANEAQLSATELRANAAEARASEAEKTLIRVEDAIRAHLLGQRPDPSSNLAAAA
jgi:hypothetical protein